MQLILASLAKLNATLVDAEWLVDDGFSLAEAALLPAIFRLECLAMDMLWAARFPAVQAWLDRGRARASFQTAVLAHGSQRTVDEYRCAGRAARGQILHLASTARER